MNTLPTIKDALQAGRETWLHIQEQVAILENLLASGIMRLTYEEVEELENSNEKIARAVERLDNLKREFRKIAPPKVVEVDGDLSKYLV